MRISLETLRKELEQIMLWSEDDPERAHGAADHLLLQYIGDDRVTYLFNETERWYA